jgi:dUTPase
MFGMTGFLDVVDNDYRNPYKIWLFNNDFDAVQFKLTWVGSTEDGNIA